MRRGEHRHRPANSEFEPSSERLEDREHFFGPSERPKRNAIADCEEVIPHRDDVWSGWDMRHRRDDQYNVQPKMIR